MTTTTVTGTITDPSSVPLAGVTVEAILTSSQGAYLLDDSAEILSRTVTTTDADGAWSMALIPNAEISPSGTGYEVTRLVDLGAQVDTVNVPVSGSPVDFASIIVDPSVTGGLAAGGVLAGTYPDPSFADADVTTFAALSPANGDVLQRKSGAWANRTLTQLAADLSVGEGVPITGCVGDGATDDYTALAAYAATLPAGATLDLRGLNYAIGTPLTLSASVILRNGTITAGAHNALRITASGVTLGANLRLTRSTSYAVTDTLAQRATVQATAPFVADRVDVLATAHSCFYLAHALCNGSTIRGGTLTPSMAGQDASAIYVAAGGTGNLDITVDGVTVPSGTQGIQIFDGKRCVVRGCRISSTTALPTLTTSGWASVSGNVYRSRSASGSPGTTGPSTDRADGNTRVVYQGSTLLNENTSTPTTPGASQWGISGGYLYIDLGGTDPNTQTITSGIVSGYGLTFYSTANGFTDMSQNIAAYNTIRETDGFGIYMQASNYDSTCVDNKTIGNTLINVAKIGNQDDRLPFAGIAWNGGLSCLSMGDHIEGAGSVSTPAPGFYASDGTVTCRGQAVGVVVASATAEGFRIGRSNDWTYSSCTARSNATSGFLAAPSASQLMRGIELIGCQGVSNTVRGVDLDASAVGSYLSVTVIGGTYSRNAQQGIQCTQTRDTFILGATCHNNGVTSFSQVRFAGDCRDCGFDNLKFFHLLAGLSLSISSNQSTAISYGKLNIASNMLAATTNSNTVRISGATGATTEYAGSGVPAIGGAVGDRYWRSDTPTVAGQRLYFCTSAGAAGSATWTGAL